MSHVEKLFARLRRTLSKRNAKRLERAEKREGRRKRRR